MSGASAATSLPITKGHIAMGAEGGRWSIGEVARRVRDSRNDADVRAWVVQKLKLLHDQGRAVDSPRARAEALLDLVRKEFLYVPDPLGTELMTHPSLLVRGVIPGGDCFPASTLLLREDGEVFPISQARVGMRIQGQNGWVRIESVSDKGTLPIDEITLLSGARVRLTGKHLVNVMTCPFHGASEACDCGLHKRVVTQVRVEDVVVGMVLQTPEQLPDHHEPMLRLVRGDLQRSQELRRVVSVERSVDEEPCFDVLTEDNSVYLPEPDVTVHNCDDKTILLATCYLAALSSAGVRCAVLGQSYAKSREIGHVLCAVHIDGAWHYTDPSASTPFGKAPMSPTWELVYDPLMPDKPFCDATACLVGPNPAAPPRLNWSQGDFVGVGQLPDGEPVTMEVIEPPSAIEAVTSEDIMIDEVNAEDSSTEAGVGSVEGLVYEDLALEPVMIEDAGPEDTEAGVAQSLDAPVLMSPEADPAQESRLAPEAVADAMFFAVPSMDGVVLWNPVEEEVGVGELPAGAAPAPTGAIPTGATGTTGPTSLATGPDSPASNEDDEQLWPAWRDYMTTLRDVMTDGLAQANRAYEGMRQAASDAGVAFPPQLPEGSWTTKDASLYASTVSFLVFAIDALEEVISGKRDLIFADVNGQAVPGVASLASDGVRFVTKRSLDSNALAEFSTAPVASQDLIPNHNDVQMGTANWYVIGGAVAAAAAAFLLPMIFDAKGTILALQGSMENITLLLLVREARLLSGGKMTPEQAVEAIRSIQKGQESLKDHETIRLQAVNDQYRAEAEKLKAEQEKLKTLLDRVLLIGGIGAITVGGIWAYGKIKSSAPAG